jgi:DNA polymerase I-like protein with 3'-5' exonuclease and polymerase domains
MKLIGFDIETTGDGLAFGLQPYRVLQGRARITSVAAVCEDGDILYGQLEPSVDYLREVLRKGLEPDTYFIGWNVAFDTAWLVACGLEDEVRQVKWLDGEVLRRAIENDTSEPKDKSYGLKPTVAKYLPDFAGYEKSVDGNFDVVDDTLLQYNTLDAGLTAKLGRIFLDELSGTQRLTLSALISKSIVPVAKAWVKGIPIDEKAVDLWEVQAMNARDKHFREFMRLSALHPSDAEPAQKMLTSPVKLKQFLHAKGHPVAKTDQVELSKYKDVPMIKAISDWKKENTAVSRFIKSIRASLEYNESDTVHPSCRLWNTYTGRFGYTSTTTKKKLQTGIAIHQFPRKSEARNCIVAPDGYLLVELDFATQESRLICDWSGDPVMQEIFDNGLDFHTYMAAIIAGIDYENMVDRVASGDKQAKEDRYLAKVVNLSCQYRTGWRKLIDVGRAQYDVIFDEPTAKRLHGLYRDTYKGVPQYWDDSIEKAKLNGFAETRGGRRCEITDWSRANSWSAESTAINFPIQGTAADMKFLMIAMTDDHVCDAAGYYMLDLHDAGFFVIPDTSEGYDCALKLRDISSSLPYEAVFGWTPRVKLPVDLKIGKAWGSLTEIK